MISNVIFVSFHLDFDELQYLCSITIMSNNHMTQYLSNTLFKDTFISFGREILLNW